MLRATSKVDYATPSIGLNIKPSSSINSASSPIGCFQLVEAHVVTMTLFSRQHIWALTSPQAKFTFLTGNVCDDLKEVSPQMVSAVDDARALRDLTTAVEVFRFRLMVTQS
jgi:hypothetical protein